jgi:hypothetical protein
MLKFLFVVNRSCINGGFSVPARKNPEDSNLTSVVAVLCVLLHLSVGHEKYY